LSAQISFLFPFRNKFVILVSNETHFVREEATATKLEYNKTATLRRRRRRKLTVFGKFFIIGSYKETTLVILSLYYVLENSYE
jgi:hypothetical protein